jgi:hypothetical protein
MVAFMGVGIPLIDRNVVPGGTEPLRPGSVVKLGAAVWLTVPAGWSVDTGGSDLSANVVTLTSGPTSVSVSVVTPPPLRQWHATPRQLWDGLGKLQAVRHGPRPCTRPAPVTTAQGVAGLSGGLADRRWIGIATVLARPTLGVDVIATGPPADFRNKADQVRGMVRDIRFAGGT